MTPGGVASLVRAGHTVLVEDGAGLGSGLTNDEYLKAGAKLVSADQAWGAKMVIKVKEPIASEYPFLRPDLLLFTYLHLAAAEELTRALLASKCTGIAYETVQLPDGSLPLLTPMSEVAGRMATQVGAHYLEKYQGGRGVLLGGVPGGRARQRGGAGRRRGRNQRGQDGPGPGRSRDHAGRLPQAFAVPG